MKILTERMPLSDWPADKSDVDGHSSLWVMPPLGKWSWGIEKSKLGRKLM